MRGIWGKLDWKGEPSGAPEFGVDPDGTSYPVNASVAYETAGHTYLLEVQLNRSSYADELRVRAYCAPQAVDCLDEVLGRPSDRVVVSGPRMAAAAVARLYASVLRDLEGVSLRPLRPGSIPRVGLDRSLGVVPVELAVEGWRQGRLFRFRLKEDFGGRAVEVECHPEDVRFVQELFDASGAFKQDSSPATPLQPQEVGDCDWSDLGGLDHVVEEIRELVEYPMRNPEPYRRLGLRLPKGILLVGPPGTGKTTIARVLARRTDSVFYAVSPADINSMWYGESERNVARLFESARGYASQGKTVLVFIDELDGMYGDRAEMHEATRRAFGQLCSEMDGLRPGEGVVVLGATNRYEDLDPALVRPGRFDRKILVGLPDGPGREAIFRIHLKGKPVAGDVDFRELAVRTDGWSGAEIAAACQKAGYLAIRRYAHATGIDVVEVRGPHVDRVHIGRADLLEAVRMVEAERQRTTGSERPGP